MPTMLLPNSAFIHLPKTGGSWVSAAIQRAGIDWRPMTTPSHEDSWAPQSHADHLDLAGIERYLEFFPRRRFFILCLAELQQAPERWLRRICRFLDVDPDFSPDLTPQNASSYAPIDPELKGKLDEYFEGTLDRLGLMIGRQIDLMTV